MQHGVTAECDLSGDMCPTDSQCEAVEALTLCVEPRDGLEAFCNFESINCRHTCVYTAQDLSTGFCTRTCIEDADCEPEGVCRPFGQTSVCRLPEVDPELDVIESDTSEAVDVMDEGSGLDFVIVRPDAHADMEIVEVTM